MTFAPGADTPLNPSTWTAPPANNCGGSRQPTQVVLECTGGATPNVYVSDSGLFPWAGYAAITTFTSSPLLIVAQIGAGGAAGTDFTFTITP